MTWRDHIIDSWRLSCWRPPLSRPAGLSASAILIVFAALVLAGAVSQFFHSDGMSSFSLYGINSILASAAVNIAIVVLFARVDPTPTTLRNLILFCAAVSSVGLVVTQLTFAADHYVSYKTAGWVRLTIAISPLVGMIFWMTGAARQVFKSIPDVQWPSLRAVAFTFCLFLAGAALPNWPVFKSGAFDRRTANVWELADSIRNAKDDGRYAAAARDLERRSAAIESRQSGRLDAALASVEQRDATQSNIFVIGLAGDSDQDVFARETKRSLEILKSRFNIGNPVVQLVNDDDAIDRYPLASIQNLSFMLRKIGARMDRDRDVLILTMTSHGSPDGFALKFDDLIDRTLDPATLKGLLDHSGIKNRILIVSACFSGTFIPELANDDTLIMTAASARRTSFGCANGRDWTYFGDALFAHGLEQQSTLTAAFGLARKQIGQWEHEQHLTPSNPQISVGKAIAQRFPALVGESQEPALPQDETAARAAGANNKMN